MQSLQVFAFGFALLFATTGCKRSKTADAGPSTSSLIFGTASPEAQQALATPVDFRLTEDNFAEWEMAQRYLDALPRSALPSGNSSAGNPIDRAVERLESSPRARTAIERTGLSVRDFVLETIALAQATEQMTTANSSSTGQIPPENLEFVEAHRSRVLLARRQRAASEEPDNNESETVTVSPATSPPIGIGASSNTDTLGDSAMGTEQHPIQRGGQRDSAAHASPAKDSAADTIPPPA